MLTALMFWVTNYQFNPVFKENTKVGEYYEIAREVYDPAANVTNVIFQRYGIPAVGDSPHLEGMQIVPFPGTLTDHDILKTVIADNYITIVGLEN